MTRALHAALCALLAVACLYLWPAVGDGPLAVETGSSLRKRSQMQLMSPARAWPQLSAEARPRTPHACNSGLRWSGVQYAPHFVGDPAPAINEIGVDLYTSARSAVHDRDLGILQDMCANTVRLRPWNVRSDHRKFLDKVREKAMSIIPTFPLATQFDYAVRNGEDATLEQLKTQFEAFAGSLHTEASVSAWSVDLSLDLGYESELQLWLQSHAGSENCSDAPGSKGKFQIYVHQVHLLLEWAETYDTLKKKPFLLPLDLSRLPSISSADGTVEKGLKKLLECFGDPKWVVGQQRSPDPLRLRDTTHFLLYFGIPVEDKNEMPDTMANNTVQKAFTDIFSAVRKGLQGNKPVVMVSSQAVVWQNYSVQYNKFTSGLVEDVGDDKSRTPGLQRRTLLTVRRQIEDLRPQLEGFLVDEWTDDLDRKTGGPFRIASSEGVVSGLPQGCEGRRFLSDMSCFNSWPSVPHGEKTDKKIFPELFGLTASFDSLGGHCMIMRVNKKLFSQTGWEDDLPAGVHCSYLRPSRVCVPVAGMAVLLLAYFLLRRCREARAESRDLVVTSGPVLREEPPLPREEPPTTLARATMFIRSERVMGPEGHGTWRLNREPYDNQPASRDSWCIRIEARVSDDQGNDSLLFPYLCLQCHVDEQWRILGEQLTTELAAERAYNHSRGIAPMDTDHMCLRATRTLHRRCLEGVIVWCEYVKGTDGDGRAQDFLDRIDGDGHDRMTELLQEMLLHRVMESLSEHVLQAPERLSYLFCGILQRAGQDPPTQEGRPHTFTIDCDVLQSGLKEMHEHADPYTWHKTLGLGMNFDDINESGIQCRERVAKTYREPRSIMVVVDFFVSYRAVFLIKFWGLLVAFYIYLGSERGTNYTTKNNGPWYRPEYVRLDFLYASSIADASIWIVLEVLLTAHTVWTRWPSLGKRSPGVPGWTWFAARAVNCLLAVVAAAAVVKLKGPQPQKDINVERQALDPRYGGGATLRAALWPLLPVLAYVLVRLAAFASAHWRARPMLLWGKPTGKALLTWRSWVMVCANWASMLLVCVLIEAYVYLPLTKDLDWQQQCGLGLFEILPPVPGQVCSVHWRTTGCGACAGAIALVWAMIFISSFIDIYFVFYIWSSIGGLIKGYERGMNNSRNTSAVIQPHVWRECQRIYGDGWLDMWKAMIDGLYLESLCNVNGEDTTTSLGTAPRNGEALNLAAAVSNGHISVLGAERLAFWVSSLLQMGSLVDGQEASATQIASKSFHPGSIPSLTQIIPAYNETVIPSEVSLLQGAQPQHAANQGDDLTKPPLGDGVNTNLAFMISQFPVEFNFLANRLKLGLAVHLFEQFLVISQIPENERDEAQTRLALQVRMWAAYRSQTIAKTVCGALQYDKALSLLKGMPGGMWGDDNDRVRTEVILAHQTYGQPAPEGVPENDRNVELLLKTEADGAARRGAESPLFLVFDLTPNSEHDIWDKVHEFLQARGGGEAGERRFYASVKAKWARGQREGIEFVAVLPRRNRLRLGKKPFLTQGKASNQLGGLRFATGHYLQALDCNMGVFIGEAFKVPYALWKFLPTSRDPRERQATDCRYLGFREYVFTSREGVVGFNHSAAEWSFGTIYQRYLSFLHERMHYGHPDFVDGFFARNRGGMSKASPVINLSEDIFAGFNVRLREDNSPHTDALEYEKGREATFQAASNFFSKIAGGAVSIMRSRDNRLITENSGPLNNLSFYFASVAFYVSNLGIDWTISIYTALFILFQLAGISVGDLQNLGTVLGTEWIFSMGLVSIVPQLLETMLEYGVVRGLYDTVCNIPAAAFFFVFQNKNISSSLSQGSVTGIAPYFFTGRPMANQHQTWKDSYITYWRLHYSPAFGLACLFLTYKVLVEDAAMGGLPMFLTGFAVACWLTAPMVFSPFARWEKMKQDVRTFWGFIVGKDGTQLRAVTSENAAEYLEGLEKRAASNKFVSMFECSVDGELKTWGDRSLWVIMTFLFGRLAGCMLILYVIPSSIFDFVWVWLWAHQIQAVLLLLLFFLKVGAGNLLVPLCIAAWAAVPFLGTWIIHDGAGLGVRKVEWVISFFVYAYFMGAFRYLAYCCCRLHLRCVQPALRHRRCHEALGLWYALSGRYLLDVLQATIVLLLNVLVTLLLLVFDLVSSKLCVAVHTRWLLNGDIAKASFTRPYKQVINAQPTLTMPADIPEV